MSSIVYVLTNEAMPDLVKIGITDNLTQRLQDLSRATGVPWPFECHYAAEVSDARKIEQMLHQLFSEYRVNPKREFFRISPEKAVIALRIGNFKEVFIKEPQLLDEEEQKALDQEKARRGKIDLEGIGVPIGATLKFSRGEAPEEATVTTGNQIIWRGNVCSLSSAAKQILQSIGYQARAYSGSAYWLYEDELLQDRRHRLEEENAEKNSTSPTA